MRIPSAWCGRRAVLAAGAGFALVTALSGCSTPSGPVAALPPEPDDEAVQRAVVRARALRLQALALAAAEHEPAGLLRDVAADHAAHLSALGVSVTDPAVTPSGTGPPTSASATGPAQAPLTATRQISDEWAAAREALGDGIAAQSPGLAVLLTRIAASRAVHADLIAARAGRPAQPVLKPAATLPSSTPVGSAPSSSAPTTSPSSSSPSSSGSASSGASAGATTPASPATGSPAGSPARLPDPQDAVTPRTLAAPSTPWLVALDRLLAGEHAAVFAYPLVIGRLSGRSRDRATDLWQEHQASRNELTQILVAATVEPVAAAAAYDTGTPPTKPSAARRLAARVELGLTALAGDAASAARGTKQRSFAAGELVAGARRWAGWSGEPIGLPGVTDVGTTVSASSAPSALATST